MAELLASTTIYHGNAENTGSAMAMRLRPCTLRENGYLQVEMARQKTVAGESSETFPTFDWADKISFRLTPFEVGEVISCLRGITVDIRDGLGFVHKSSKNVIKVQVSHIGEPEPMVLVSASQKSEKTEETKEVAIKLTMAEAMSVEYALYASMGNLFFG